MSERRNHTVSSKLHTKGKLRGTLQTPPPLWSPFCISAVDDGTFRRPIRQIRCTSVARPAIDEGPLNGLLFSGNEKCNIAQSTGPLINHALRCVDRAETVRSRRVVVVAGVLRAPRETPRIWSRSVPRNNNYMHFMLANATATRIISPFAPAALRG